MNTGTQAESLVSNFLADSRALIVDSSSSARTRLVTGLVQLGAKRHNILSTGSFEEAQANISSDAPRIVLCDFTISGRSGLDLLQEQRASNPDLKQCVFVLVTANTAQSAVARAAEEDVDTFILKPYTQEIFRKSLTAAVSSKINPNEYLKTIESGRTKLSHAEIDDAIQYFEKAMEMSPQPTLACYYLGQTDLMRDSVNKATQNFEKGLTYSRIHYKCLVGLFEVLTQQKRHAESYDVVKRIAQYFPANPARLASALRLAIVTNNYDDIESYYRIFLQLDERPDELINYMCSALAVTGKHYLLKKANRRALELLEKAIVSSAGRTRFIRYAIECLIESNMSSEADGWLKRFPREAREGEDYAVSDLLVMGKFAQSGRVLQRGRELLKKGIESAPVYQVMIEHAARSGQIETAEDLLRVASAKWPAHSGRFKKLLAKNLETA